MNRLITILRCSQAGVGSRLRLNMKFISSFVIPVALVALGQGATPLLAAEDEGVALSIIYDTSGSMREPVRDSTGKPSPKYVIANRALVAISKQLRTFATNTPSGAPRKINTGLF